MSSESDPADSTPTESTDPAPVLDTVDSSFEHDVMRRSQERLVVVDFWAAWCQPCRMLGPILEKICREFPRQVQLVKANTEENQQAASEFQVEGIPAVFAVWKGKVIDFFSGVMPEAALREWLRRTVHGVQLELAQALEKTDPLAALEAYDALVTEYPDDAKAKIGLGRIYLAQGNFDECKMIIDRLEQRGFLESEAQRLKSEWTLQTLPKADIAALRTEAERSKNFASRLTLAKALAGEGAQEESLAICLAIIQEDRRGAGEEARLWMLEVFRTLPPDSELLRDYRRKLASALY
jgi:putative thioredoxin